MTVEHEDGFWVKRMHPVLTYTATNDGEACKMSRTSAACGVAHAKNSLHKHVFKKEVVLEHVVPTCTPGLVGEHDGARARLRVFDQLATDQAQNEVFARPCASTPARKTCSSTERA